MGRNTEPLPPRIRYVFTNDHDPEHGMMVWGNLVFECQRSGARIEFDGYPCEALIGSMRAALAFDDTKLVGWLGGHVSEKTSTFCSHGTWVHRRYRKCGIATGLWDMMLEKTAARIVRATAVTDRGMTLILGVSEKHLETRFEIYDDGNRRLRNLRTGKPLYTAQQSPFKIHGIDTRKA